ncbi:hypothetical protein M9194_09740 [Vibrio sp. S4M6]|uniref:polysaccharide biosynthesis C-terminal domain-containing protein n=1 Tax=Vibrio sinus TaxID=2946865 RepID=UPI00202A60FD|nr:hypothetical protein [Vibrio sinus]MCL9781706.1 hypothetical protein [Vibrio sinus]
MINIKEFTSIGSDERGDTKSFSVKDYGQFVYLTRKAGCLSGNTYHQGLNKGTNLKTFVLVQGEITINYRKVDTTEVHTQVVPSPAVIEVSPNVVHNVMANTDIVILENNSIDDIKADVIREQV